jgi:tRNA(fMet)-specific endonuclease VapC
VIHLDINAAIALLNGRPPAVRVRLGAAVAAAMPVALSIIVYHELMYGAAASERRTANEDKIAVLIAGARMAVLPFETADAEHAADIRASLRRAGCSIGSYDVLIAAQARRAAATLVTANTGEFDRVPGLTIADWSR